MKSGLARLRPKAAVPVPISGRGGWAPSGGAALGGDREAYMRAYGSVGTVWQIVFLLASNVAKPTWHLYRKSTDGRRRYSTADTGSDQRVEVVRHPALTVLQRPNPFYSRFALIEASQQHLELTGEAWWVVERDPRSTIPLGLWPVRPDRMSPVRDERAYIKGYVYTSPDGREKVPLATDEVIFAKYPNPLDPYRGLGPVQSILADVDAAKYSAEWNRNFFLNSAEPGGVIQVDHELSDDEWNELVNRWRETHRGVARAHRVAVLEGGQTWVPNAHTIRDMDFKNLRDLERDLIREAWGIHKIMLGNSDDVNRANAQTGEEVFANWSIKPRLDRWRDVLNYQLLPLFGSAGESVEFDYFYPLPANREQDVAELVAKTSAVQTLVAAGFDAAAALEVVGLPDMPWTAPPGGEPAEKEEINAGALVKASLPPERVLRNGPLAGKDTAAKVYEQQAEDYPPHAMAWMHHAAWKGPVEVPLDHVTPDMKWMDGADPDHVQDFVKRLEKGKKLKPVILVACPGETKLHLIDGHHRYLACAEMGEPVRAYIGTVSEDHGPWETMHDYQFDHGKGHKGGGDGPGNHFQPFAVPDHAELLRRVLGDGYVPIDSARR